MAFMARNTPFPGHVYSENGHVSGIRYLADVAKILECRGLRFRPDAPSEAMGNCFPYSVAQQLHRPEIRATLSQDMIVLSKNYHALRLSIVGFVRDISPLSEYYMPIHEAVREYCFVTQEDWAKRLEEISRDRSWFDDQFLQFTAWFLRRDIFCHSMKYTKKFCASAIPIEGSYRQDSPCDCVAEPLHIANVRNVHFQSLIPTGSSMLSRDGGIRGSDSIDTPLASTPNLPYRCDSCNKSYAKPQFLNRHIKIDHPAIYLCDECGQKFPSPQLLGDHCKAVHTCKDKICPICSKTFENVTLLTFHMETAHNNNRKNITEKGKLKSSRPLKGKAPGKDKKMYPRSWAKDPFLVHLQ